MTENEKRVIARNMILDAYPSFEDVEDALYMAGQVHVDARMVYDICDLMDSAIVDVRWASDVEPVIEQDCE